ncbi:MAG: gamma carbonic anhydrase family protein [Chloroflexi bacterium]|nr:gamma carbonic anhydrase family protein [Chloroflexota bacterium]MBV9544566.1 gamma carbonic anhydrase family protein [Chloroflexota bacterium]
MNPAPWVAPGARVVGDVRMAEESSLWYSSVLDGTAAAVVIDAQANVQDNCVVAGVEGHSARIGARVSMGHNARVFGAIVGERALIAIGATVHVGAVIGPRAIVAANATVPEGMQVPPRKLVVGRGRILRDVTDAEIERIEHGADEYVRLSREHAERDRQATATGPARS